ncbi:hypothetical protein Pd630_LPD11027 (plasmid) [Rhodococcus opacus PD630]|nr:hypothetical protein Pd630_LPD11027 [Rhodococcus opacus PD630]
MGPLNSVVPANQARVARVWIPARRRRSRHGRIKPDHPDSTPAKLASSPKFCPQLRG